MAKMKYTYDKHVTKLREMVQDIMSAPYLMEADDDVIDALYELGTIYLDASSGYYDPYEAFEFFKKGAEYDNIKCIFKCAETYASGNDDIPQDLYLSACYYQDAVDLGNAEAMYVLGNLYMNGKGRPQNYKKAILLFEEAAKHKHDKAEEALKSARRKQEEVEVLKNEYDPSRMVLAGARLLTINEYAQNNNELPLGRWWLDSSSFEYNKLAMIYGTELRELYSVQDAAASVRPVLEIRNGKALGLKRGSRFVFGGIDFYTLNESLAIAEDIIGHSTYSSNESNEYKTSSIKEKVDAWFNSCMESTAAFAYMPRLVSRKDRHEYTLVLNSNGGSDEKCAEAISKIFPFGEDFCLSRAKAAPCDFIKGLYANEADSKLDTLLNLGLDVKIV